LLDWGKGMARSSDKAEKIGVPLAVLVNGKTAAAAEALAAALRQAGAGLVLGSRTAGQATIAQEYPLKNGERLRIASTPVLLGDGSSLSSKGVQPDISVNVSLEDDRAYFADAFREPAARSAAPASTNNLAGSTRVRRPRFNEAELVRERRNGVPVDSELAGTDESDSEKPVVRDPVLGRALDFLKGLNLVRSTRS
jgi:C-terminal processing protease CtpA/Prc